MKKGVFFATCLIVASLAGCKNGGGSGTAVGPAPMLTRMDVLNSQPGVLAVYVDFVDSEGDITSVTADLYDEHRSIVSSETGTIDGISGIVNGTLYGELDYSDLAFGTYSFDVFLTDSGGRRSNVLSKAFSAEGGLGSAANYPNPSNYLYLGDTAIGDLDGDGRNDVVAIQGSNNTGLVLFYKQTALGQLDSPVILDMGSDTRGVTIADMNGDGRSDLIVSSPGSLIVLYQDPGTGQLSTRQTYTVSSSYVFGVAAADLNGDGRSDSVVMAGQAGSAGGLSLFFQNSDGTLRSEATYTHVNIFFQGEIHVADMNNDGLNDIVVQSGQKELAVIRQTTPGAFSTTPDRYTVQTSYWPNFTAFALGDLDGDGLTDMVAADPGNSSYLNIFLQNAQGTLNGPALVPISATPFGVEAADMTGDGLNDIIIDVSGALMVFPQLADHTFGAGRYYSYQSASGGGSPVHQALSVGDVTGRGRLDAVVTWSDEGLYVYPYAAQLTVH